MKRILHLIDTGGPGGAETVYVDLVRGLDPERWRSYPVLPIRNWMYGQLEEHVPEPILLESKRSFDFMYLFRLVRILRKYNIDIIHAHLLGQSLYGSLAGWLCGVPAIATLHGRGDLAPDESFRKLKFQIINHASARTVFVSESLRHYFFSKVQLCPDRTEVIFNGVDPTIFMRRRDTSVRKKLGIGNDAFLVGAVGNLRSDKDYFTLLHAAAQLKKRSAAYKFIIVGQADNQLYRDLSILQRQLDLEDDVSFLGFRDDVHRIMNNLDLYLITSRSEGFSLSTIQALAAGVPVVATKCGGPEEIITDGEHGMLVDVQSPNQIARAVEHLRNRPDERERFMRAGQMLIGKRFTVNEQVSQYERLYGEILGPHHRMEKQLASVQ